MNGLRAGWSAFNIQGVTTSDPAVWDEYGSRLARYALYDQYANNTVYDALVNSAATLYKERQKLFRFTQGIYNPVSRQADLYESFVYGGTLEKAIPLIADNDALLEPVSLLYKWSRWAENKSLYVRTGVINGDVFLKVIDEPDKKRVRLEVLHPSKVVGCLFDSVGNITAVKIEYEVEEADETALLSVKPSTRRPKTYTYTEIITKEYFATYKDGEPFAFTVDENGNGVAEWPNIYGFVPLVLAKHRDIGAAYGQNAMHASRTKIDSANSLASAVDVQITKAITPIWYLAGVRQSSEISATTEEKDTVPMLYGPEGSQPWPMVFNLPIDQAMTVLERKLRELHDDMPELNLQTLREFGNLTAPGVKAGFSDGANRINSARGNYNAALVRATQMAVTIGAIRNLEGFRSFNEDSYDAGDMELSIGERSIIDDALTLLEKVTVLGTVATQPVGTKRAILDVLGYSEDEIDEIIDADSEQQSKETADAVRGLMQAAFTPEEDDAEDAETPSGTEQGPVNGNAGATANLEDNQEREAAG